MEVGRRDGCRGVEVVLSSMKGGRAWYSHLLSVLYTLLYIEAHYKRTAWETEQNLIVKTAQAESVVRSGLSQSLSPPQRTASLLVS